MSNPFKYSEEIYDEETGFYYLRTRYYDPKVGRFISEDTYRTSR
ncbi:RHS repeat-associated core domain-containing protein [Brevibacillus fortis]